MDQNLQNQITFNDVLKVLPKKEKPKRKTEKEAKNIIKKAIKGRVKGITQEQGFRQYKKYTEPLLFDNNSLDQSEIASSLAKILNFIAPKKVEEQKLKEVEKFIKNEIPVNVPDVQNEITPTPTPVVDRKLLARAAEKRIPLQLGGDENIIDELNKKAKEKTQQRKEKAQKVLKELGQNAKYKKLKSSYEEIAKEAAKDGAEALQEKSSIKIQKAVRNYNAKKELTNLQKESNIKNEAVMKIQKAVRGKKARDTLYEKKSQAFQQVVDDAIKNDPVIQREKRLKAALSRATTNKEKLDAVSTLQSKIRAKQTKPSTLIVKNIDGTANLNSLKKTKVKPINYTPEKIASIKRKRV